MQCTCDRSSLASALVVVERATAAREAIPVLSGIRLTVQEDRLTLVGTDLEMTAVAWVPAEVGATGDRIVDARLFTALVRRLAGSSVSLSLGGEDGSTLVVSGGAATFTLYSTGTDDFPELPAIDAGWRLVLDPIAFRRGVAQTAFAAASSDQRPVLSGVFVETDDTTLRLVATDSSRLAYREVSLPQPPEPVGGLGLEAVRAVVPGRALVEMQRLCELAEDRPVILEVGTRLARFRTEDGRFMLTTRLIEGNFPPYRQVFLDELPTRVHFPRQDMLEALQRAELLARKGPAVVVIEADTEGLTVRAREADVGQGEEHIEASLEGPPVQTAYQVRFLAEMLKAFDVDEVRLEVGNPERQGTFRIPSDPGYRYILMPVRLS